MTLARLRWWLSKCRLGDGRGHSDKGRRIDPMRHEPVAPPRHELAPQIRRVRARLHLAAIVAQRATTAPVDVDAENGQPPMPGAGHAAMIGSAIRGVKPHGAGLGLEPVQLGAAVI